MRLALCFFISFISPELMAAMPYQADSPASMDRDEKAHFNIDPQSLITAMREYSEMTGQAVMIDDALAVGRNSPGVRGDFSKVDALLMLLVGTGLTARYVSDQAFTLSLINGGTPGIVGVHPIAGSIVNPSSDEVSERYAGQIQRQIEAALCQSDKTRPGKYRLALQIWISSSGKVERTQLLNPTQGKGTRDPDVIQLMDQLRLDPPPAPMSQPITLLFLPGRVMSASGCSALPYFKREQ
jgi:hypothetical protein